MSKDRRETLYLKTNPVCPEAETLARAAALLRAGGTVAFPTETVYGLGANALDPGAVARIFEAKGRPSDNPLIVHIASPQDIGILAASVPPVAYQLAGAFWPGPLTLILPKSARVPGVVSAGLPTVALRMPGHPVALALIGMAGVPVAAPSANLSGKPSPTLADHVWEDLQGRIDALVDGGPTQVGLESTVLDLTQSPPVILRPGGITAEALASVIGPVEVDPALAGEMVGEAVPKAPGMKYTHYAPEAELILVAGPPEAMVGRIGKMALEATAGGRKVGILATDENLSRYPVGEVLTMGSRNNLQEVAANIYKALRDFDRLGVDLILAETLPETGLGAAIMNRLKKAAGQQVIRA